MMSDDRLPTGLFVEGHLKTLDARGVFYYILNKGPYSSGVILVKISNRQGQCRAQIQQRDLDGQLGWVDIFDQEIIEESKVDAYIHREIDRDPDLWVIEIEEPDMSNPFVE